MRIRLRDLFLAFALSLFSPCGFLMLQAQDVSFPGTEMEDLGVEKETEKMRYSPGELDPAFKKSQAGAITRDSVGIKPILKTTKITTDSSKAPVKRPSQDDDSILSFNFLYYIFQKYKMQDMVD